MTEKQMQQMEYWVKENAAIVDDKKKVYIDMGPNNQAEIKQRIEKVLTRQKKLQEWYDNSDLKRL